MLNNFSFMYSKIFFKHIQQQQKKTPPKTQSEMYILKIPKRFRQANWKHEEAVG